MTDYPQPSRVETWRPVAMALWFGVGMLVGTLLGIYLLAHGAAQP